MTLNQKIKIRKCFDYERQNLSEMIDISEDEVYIIPSNHWDLEWITIKEKNKKYSLKWKARGKEKEFAESDLSFTQVKKMINLYK